MKKITILIFSTIITTQLNAMTTIHCHSATDLSYTYENRTGGARPMPGSILTVEEITKENNLLYRKLNRIPCTTMPNCHIQQPELQDFNPNNLAFQFDQNSKIIIESNGQEFPIKTETYNIKFILDQPNWMICDYFNALYP